MKNFQFILTFLLLSATCFGQDTIYHSFYSTASDMDIRQWNIDKNNLPDFYLQETVDSKNRVTELKFISNGQVIAYHLCYLSTWIKYEYPNDTTIIEYYLDSNGKENAEIECDMPSKIKYVLSKDKKTILETKSEYNINKELYLNHGWTEEMLDRAIESLESENRTYSFVSYYEMSFYKLNNIFPISKDFDIDQFLFSDKEKEEIIKSIKK